MFERHPSSVQILLALAEEEIKSCKEGTGTLNGNYAGLRARLSELGVDVPDGQSPEETYQAAVQHFKRSQSFYHSKGTLPVAKKAVAG